MGSGWWGIEEITSLGLLFACLSDHCSYLNLRPFQLCDLNLPTPGQVEIGTIGGNGICRVGHFMVVPTIPVLLNVC